LSSGFSLIRISQSPIDPDNGGSAVYDIEIKEEVGKT